MCDPVVAADGHTKASIGHWLKTSNLSPLTGSLLENKNLIPNHALRKAIDDYCRNDVNLQKERKESQKLDFITAKVATTRRVESESPSWEFDKKLLRQTTNKSKRTVIVSCSRNSLYSGEGTIGIFEPTDDGSKFITVYSQILKLSKNNNRDCLFSKYF